MARRYEDQIAFVGVAGLSNEDAMREFVQSFGLDGIEHAVDGDGGLWARFGVPYQPAWVFIDSSGGSARILGSLAEADLLRVLDDLARDLLPA